MNQGTDSTSKPISATDALTEEVLSRFEESDSERFKEISESLVRHLHAFLREVELTEEEWERGIEFLTRTGHITDDKRQEFILLSDVLGASMQVIDINNQKPGEATESTVFGPFFVEDSPHYENGDDLSNGAKGEPCYMHGRVLDTSGSPIPGAHLEVWQSDEDGFYDVQYEGLDRPQNRGQLEADERGGYGFWAVKPVAYPIPYDGPVGDLLKAANRSPMRPAHVHFMVQAEGYETLITHVFEEGDEYLDSDAVFGVKDSLITDFERHDAGEAPDGTRMDEPFYTMKYDLVLASVGEKGARLGEEEVARMKKYATITEAIAEACRQHEESVKESPDSRNVVFQTAEGSYGAHTVHSSQTSEFGSQYALVGEITGEGEYWEYDREVLRENGLRVIE